VHPRLQISTARLQPFEFFITYIIKAVTHIRINYTIRPVTKVLNECRNHPDLRCHPVRTSFERKWTRWPTYLQTIQGRKYQVRKMAMQDTHPAK